MASTFEDALRVSLTTFAEYLTASASSKIDCVKDQIQIYSKDYQRGPWFYHAFVDGVVKGRTSGADHLVMQATVNSQRDDPKRQHYEVLAKHWLALTDLHQPLVGYGRAEWLTPTLAVSIRPDFVILGTNDQPSTVKLWLKERELGDDAARAMLWLFEHHMTEICAGATPLVVDVRREKIYRRGRRPWKRGFDVLLENEAASLARLWEKFAAA